VSNTSAGFSVNCCNASRSGFVYRGALNTLIVIVIVIVIVIGHVRNKTCYQDEDNVYNISSSGTYHAHSSAAAS